MISAPVLFLRFEDADDTVRIAHRETSGLVTTRTRSAAAMAFLKAALDAGRGIDQHEIIIARRSLIEAVHIAGERRRSCRASAPPG
jgi:hypothetical protein